MNKGNVLILLLCCCSFAGWTLGQETGKSEPAKDESPAAGAPESKQPTNTASISEKDAATHEELRNMRLALTEALKTGDIDGQLAHAHPNIVTTWQNGKVARGHDGLRKFIQENVSNQKVFRGYKVEPEADDLTILYGGDTGVVFGRSVPQYSLAGMDFELENRWTATLVKEDDKWKIAAYHVSANILDNPILNIAKRSVYLASGVSLVVGLIVGAIATTILRRKK